MANEKIKLMAKANQLGVKGYRNMSETELQSAIAAASSTAKTATPAKGKTAPAAKGKTTSAAKGKTGTAAKGKTPAKATPTPAKKTAPAKGKSAKTVKATPAKSTAKKTPAKAKASQGATQAKRSPARGTRKAAQGAARLDNSSIDWKAESNVGQSGKRKDVMDALRRFKGDKAKVFDKLAPNAKRYYKGKTKHEAERTLVWLIGRVAFDFAMATGQHTPGQRAEYGTSTAEQDIRRRERRAEASRPARAPRKAAAKKTPAKGKGKSKTAAKKR